MATRRRKPPGKDIGDLKSRLGLGATLEKRPVEPEPEPPPAQFAPGSVTVNQGQPGGPPMGQMPPQGHPGAPGHPGFGGPPRRPPFAQKPPRKKPKPKPQEAWSPPASDPNAASDVPIKSHRSLGQMLAAVAVISGVGLFCIIVGFVFGNGRQARAMYDAQSRDANRILEAVEPRIETIRKLQGVASKHDGLAPDAEVIEKLSVLDFVVEPEEIARDKLILGPETTSLLIRFSADTKLLAEMLKRHRTMTSRVDKKELEELSKAGDANKAAGYAVIFDASGFASNLGSKKETRPAEGRLMIFDSFDTTDKDGEKYVKLRSPTSGGEKDWSLKKLVLLDKKEMLKSSGPNALRRYERRHKEIAAKLKEVSQYSDSLAAQLRDLGERDPAPLLSL